MHATMNKKRSRFDSVLAIDDSPVFVDHHQIRWRELGPMEALRVDQEFCLIARHFKTEMITDTFIEAHACCGTQGGGQIDAGLGDGIKAFHRFLQLCFSESFCHTVAWVQTGDTLPRDDERPP